MCVHDLPPNRAAANRRYAFQFVSHWFYNIIGFGGRALPAPVAELGRWLLLLRRFVVCTLRKYRNGRPHIPTISAAVR